MVLLALAALLPYSPLEVERLIDRLTTVGQPIAAAYSTAWLDPSMFMATEDRARYGDGAIVWHGPPVDPTMRHLVRMGVRALPALICHLSDSRNTRLAERYPEGGVAMWFSDEYDPRFKDPRRRPPGLGWPHEEDPLKTPSYTLQVGDPCYEMVGQIVNRALSPLRMQPTACEVVNSPVHAPALAAAVARDWGRFTADAQTRRFRLSFGGYGRTREARVTT